MQQTVNLFWTALAAAVAGSPPAALLRAVFDEHGS